MSTLAPLPILYSFRRCPYAMRARMALDYAGVPVRLREVVLRAKPAHLLEISPKGTVPVLALPGGRVLDQSLDIMRWACEQADPENWAPPASTEAGQHWLSLNDGPFKQWLDRYKYPERHLDWPLQHYREQGVQTLLQPMEAQLQKAPYLMGEAVSLVDVALMPFVRQFAQVDAAWFASAPFPQLKVWLDRWLASTRFERVMQKFEPWAPDHADTVF